MFRLESDRLYVRPWISEDRTAFVALMSDPEVMHFINDRRAFTEQEADDYIVRQIRQVAEHGVCMGAVVEKSSERVIGLGGVQPLGTTGDLEIGWIFSRDTWGHGYATELGRAAMDHVLETLQRPRVVAIIDPGNLASKRVAARLGMEYEARYTGAQLGHRKPEIVVDLFVRTK